MDIETCLLMATDSQGRWLRNPWQYPDYKKLALEFIQGHTVLMGREAWFDFPFKEDTDIAPWILSNNQHFHMYTKQRYVHACFSESLDVLCQYPPTKGIWWVLGGSSVFRATLPYADSLEVTTIHETRGLGVLPIPEALKKVSRCPHPYNAAMDCVRYVRQQSYPPLYLQQVQAGRVRQS